MGYAVGSSGTGTHKVLNGIHVFRVDFTKYFNKQDASKQEIKEQIQENPNATGEIGATN